MSSTRHTHLPSLSFPPHGNTPSSTFLSPAGNSFLCPRTLLCPLTTSHPHCAPWPALTPQPAGSHPPLPSPPAVRLLGPCSHSGPARSTSGTGTPKGTLGTTQLPFPGLVTARMKLSCLAFLPEFLTPLPASHTPLATGFSSSLGKHAAFVRELWVLRPPK